MRMHNPNKPSNRSYRARLDDHPGFEYRALDQIWLAAVPFVLETD